MRKTSYAFVISFVSLAVFMGFLPAIAAAVTSGKVVNIIGEEGFKANSRVFATFRFSPGSIQVNQGEVITFVNIVTNDTHTISLVDASSLPTTIQQVFMCGAPGTVCAAIFAAHIPNGFGPNGPNPPILPFVNVPGNPAGFEQGNLQGNSLLVTPGQTVEVTISASSGTSLHFMCAIHPWMQGEINVK